ncbi:MAG: DUF4956 domain-containing protein [Parvularculaceae bacterium]
MRAAGLAGRLTAYYVAVTAVVYAGAQLIPGFEHYLPIGGAQKFLSGGAHDPFTSIEIGAQNVNDLKESLLWLVIAVLGAVLTVLPMAWTYMAIRTHEEYDQSLVETILILPIAVTSIVIIVNESLALAFGLAGIVGGVRFRNTLKSPGDALYVLAAIGVGLAAGVGALEIALVMTVIFNYCILILWIADFGARQGARRFMRHAVEGHPDETFYEHSDSHGHKHGHGHKKKHRNGHKHHDEDAAEHDPDEAPSS